MQAQSKKAAEEAKLAKKQEESEAVRQAHREEARLKEEVTCRRLEAKVTLTQLIPLPSCRTTQPCTVWHCAAAGTIMRTACWSSWVMKVSNPTIITGSSMSKASAYLEAANAN